MSEDKTANSGTKWAQKSISRVEFIRLLKLHETLKSCAEYFGVSEDTISRFCKAEFDQTFAEVSTHFRAETKTFLKHIAIDLASKGDKDMLKLFLKNWTDIKDTNHVEVNETKHVKVTVETLKEALKSDPMIDAKEVLEIETKPEVTPGKKAGLV